ncbi:MAG: anhydro-N-acetylmuramic acid kinase, partial [Bacillota bacterium]
MALNSPARWFARYANKKVRQLVALHSGTSANGVDAAVIRVSGSGESARAELVHHLTYDYPESIQAKLFEVFDPKTATISKISQAHFLLGELFSEAAKAVVAAAGLSMAEIDAVASS